MIYIYDTIEGYSHEQYLKHLDALPIWRREKALQYKRLDDRKRSVLAYVLLQRALKEEYGITDIPEFVYNEFGKPSFSDLPIHFSLSHCKDAVVCAVSDHNIGIDVENIVPYNYDIARRICTEEELEILAQSMDKDADLIKLWTVKEAISKYEGMGLSLSFAEIEPKGYITFTYLCPKKQYVISTCNLTKNNIYRIEDTDIRSL